MAKRIGIFWMRVSEKGKTHLSGVLDRAAFAEVRVAIFKKRLQGEGEPAGLPRRAERRGSPGRPKPRSRGAGQKSGF